MLNRSHLHSYQEEAVAFIHEKQTCALFLGLGSGKTVSTLTAYGELLDDFAINRVLIIAPLRVSQTVWDAEASEWEHTKHLRFSKVLGTTKQRVDALKVDAEFYVINRENIMWLVDYLGDTKKKWPFDAIIVDESSSFKNPTSKRFRALKKIAKVLEKNKDVNINIEGHTDDVGDANYNWDLSVKRATSVVKIITANSKLDPKRITASGRGEFFPIEKSQTKEARAKNRRTEIILEPNFEELINILNSKTE